MIATQRKSTRIVGRLVGASTRLQIREALWAYALLLPWIIGLVLFWAGPIVASLVLSLTKYDVIRPPTFVGVANYQTAFFEDNLVWPSLGRTLKYALAVVPLGLVGSLILAMLLNRGLKGTNIYRTLFYLPALTPTVATALLWQWLLHPVIGPVNASLGWLGIDGPGWMVSEQWALPALVIMNLWSSMGSTRMLIFLAALQGVPQSLLEAAEIDGAGRMAKFWHITVPVISPTILFNLVMGVIRALKVFASAFVATEGGPSYATWFYALHIYNQAFKYFRLGYGSALAWIFVVVLLIFTFVQLRLSRSWVYYAGE